MIVWPIITGKYQKLVLISGAVLESSFENL